MTIKIIKGTMAGGKPAAVGAVLTLPAKEERALIDARKAEAYEGDAAPEPEAPPSPQPEPEAPASHAAETAPAEAGEPTGEEEAFEPDPDLGPEDERVALTDLNRDQLVGLAKDHGVKGISKLSDAKLIEAIEKARAEQAA